MKGMADKPELKKKVEVSEMLLEMSCHFNDFGYLKTLLSIYCEKRGDVKVPWVLIRSLVFLGKEEMLDLVLKKFENKMEDDDDGFVKVDDNFLNYQV